MEGGCLPALLRKWVRAAGACPQPEKAISENGFAPKAPVHSHEKLVFPMGPGPMGPGPMGPWGP